MLTPPTLADLLTFSRWPSSEDERRDEDALRRATDLMEVASSVDEDPAPGTTESRILRDGVLAMAHAMIVRQPDEATIASPYSSEKIGSWSYQKAQNDVLRGLPTGIWAFDVAVSFLRGDEVDHSSEAVFAEESFEPAPPWHGGLGPGVRG